MTARTPTQRRSAFLTLALSAALLLGCSDDSGSVHTVFVLSTPRERYQASLEEAGLHQTALARDWMALGERSLEHSTTVQVPYAELRFLDPSGASAVSYRVGLERGQRLAVRVEPTEPPTDLRLFMDLFYVSAESEELGLVWSADSLAWEIDYIAQRPGDYIVRVQPELLRGGRFSVTVSAHASLGFPVAGHSLGSVRSRFGVARDGGRREHHGLDIFARRGTPVLAAVAGRARPSTNGLGGTVVWLRDSKTGQNLYYAHLDRWAFDRSRWVEPGDTIGFVGNSGNARTTPPHLHFGVYLRGVGAVNPWPHLYEPTERPQEFTGDHGWVGQGARVAQRRAVLREAPSTGARTIRELARHTSLVIVSGSGRWYRVRLPDLSEGYVAAAATELLDEPTGIMMVAGGSRVLSSPSAIAGARDTVVTGEMLPVLGTYAGYTFVETNDGVQGWVRSGALEPTVGPATNN